MTAAEGLPRELAWLVADGDRLVSLTGWIGEHPQDGSDVAHLLLHPLGDGQAQRMRQVAELFGLGPATTGLLDVPPDTTLARVAATYVTLRYRDSDTIGRPVPAEWVKTALAQRFVIVTLGMDGLTGVTSSGQRLDRYLARVNRLRIGRVRVLTE